jgi:putative FmdB family regulatory protein
MPIYECRCDACKSTFEVLAPLSRSNDKTRPCPDCGGPARRIISVVSFSVAGAAADGGPESRPRPGNLDVTQLRLPNAARLCWMDDRSASRLAAYKTGRGAEYDDTVAAREDLQRKRGEPPAENGRHDRPHSPLADPRTFARRAAAARRTKVAQSAAMKKST